MAINRIVKYGLEKRAKDLKGRGKSEREIASLLSVDANQTITQSSVNRYFAVRDQVVKEAIQQNDKLKEKAAQLELDTVLQRQDIIKEIQELARQAKKDGELKTALYGLDKAISAMDSLDKRLGRLTGDGTIVNVNVQVNQYMGALVAVISKHCNLEQQHELRGDLLGIGTGATT